MRRKKRKWSLKQLWWRQRYAYIGVLKAILCNVQKYSKIASQPEQYLLRDIAIKLNLLIKEEKDERENAFSEYKERNIK